MGTVHRVLMSPTLKRSMRIDLSGLVNAYAVSINTHNDIYVLTRINIRVTFKPGTMTRAHVQFAIKDERKRGQERRRKRHRFQLSMR